jgi:preprotein translocase subunit SecY
VLHRITAFGALFLGIVAVIPYFMQFITPGGLTPQQSMIVDSAGLLIVVGVVVDTIKQLQAQLLMRNYEGFIK